SVDYKDLGQVLAQIGQENPPLATTLGTSCNNVNQSSTPGTPVKGDQHCWSACSYIIVVKPATTTSSFLWVWGLTAVCCDILVRG
ncbi:unnamed protein product, partial [Pylaiella littoralis]